jgi:hypothetical protein
MASSGITSSVVTLKSTSVCRPNEVTMATSVASRPCAIRMRPIRGSLCRGVEGIPAAAKIGLEPGAEVHRQVFRGHANVAEIAGAIARRNVHAAAQRDGEMGEVPAHPRLSLNVSKAVLATLACS